MFGKHHQCYQPNIAHTCAAKVTIKHDLETSDTQCHVTLGNFSSYADLIISHFTNLLLIPHFCCTSPFSLPRPPRPPHPLSSLLPHSTNPASFHAFGEHDNVGQLLLPDHSPHVVLSLGHGSLGCYVAIGPVISLQTAHREVRG